jgi:hypothetical protein
MTDNQTAVLTVAGPFAAPPEIGRKVRFSDPRLLTTVLQTLLAISAALAAVSVLSSVAQYQLLHSHFTHDAAVANDSRQRLISIARLMAMLVTMIVFARWTYVVARNARALGARGLSTSPGWAVGWYFVPIAWLWKPFVAMQEIWKSSRFPYGWIGKPTDPILILWWIGWVGSNILGDVAFQLSFRARTVEALNLSTMINIADQCGDLFAYVAALIMVTRLCQIQITQRASVNVADIF